MTDLVALDHVVVSRGDFTLDVPSWRVPAGVVVGVVGPNGAGKSTLLSLLPGLSAPDQGVVRVSGLDPVAQTIEVRQSLGFMTDDLPLPAMTVGRLLWFLSGYWPTWNAGLVATLVDRFALDLGKSTGALSKGEGTRLRLVMAMAFEPRVLVLDEPATGLDVHGRRALLQSVLDVVKDPARSVIVSSHDLVDVERVCDRLLVLQQGRVIAEGLTSELVGEDRTLEEAAIAWGA